MWIEGPLVKQIKNGKNEKAKNEKEKHFVSFQERCRGRPPLPAGPPP
jgi:hypothetical protein